MTNQPNKSTVKDSWKLIGHSHQIADTGDYDGHYEITNGKISLLTQDDDDESLQPIVDALNDSGCKFYQDDWFEFENKMLKDENAGLRERVKELEAQLSEMSEINEEDDIAWSRMKEIRADDYDLGTEREEEIFQFAFFEGIRYIQKALKK